MYTQYKKKPWQTYKTFYNNQSNVVKDPTVIIKIIADINTRLTENSPINNDKILRQKLIDIRNKFSEIYYKDNVDPSELYLCIFDWIQQMHNFLSKYDTSFNDNYFSNFAKPVLQYLYNIGDGTQLFFTFQPVDHIYLIHIRPLCLYLVWLLDIPNFANNINIHSPLIASTTVKTNIEGSIVDFREVTMHDLGHSYVMKRNDKWLFDSTDVEPIKLIHNWLKIKNLYLKSAQSLYTDYYGLYKAIILYIFDIVHDRGYQFSLPILQQQFTAIKNLENIKTKIQRNNFQLVADEYTIDYIDQAQQWLINFTKQLQQKHNTYAINKYKNIGYTISWYPPVANYTGIPIEIQLHKDGLIYVKFQCNKDIIITSLYEIELLGIDIKSEKILTIEKINEINKKLLLFNRSDSKLDYLVLEADGTIDTYVSENVPDIYWGLQFDLKSIQIFKLERLVRMLNKSCVNFSVTSKPTVWNLEKLAIFNNCIMLDNKLYNLSQINIDKLNTKSINLNYHARYVDESILRSSYIIKLKNSDMVPYVKLNFNNIDYELAIVDTCKHPVISRAVSSLLSRSIEDAKDIYENGYLPSDIVINAQKTYVSEHGVSNLWASAGYRFVISHKVGNNIRKIVATALISSSKSNLFFYTSKYNNIQLDKDINLDLVHDISGNKWFDKFDMPSINEYKPVNYNQLANFTVEHKHRGINFGKFFPESIIDNYANMLLTKPGHSQPLICGQGLFQIADPSWYSRMIRLGFKHRLGAETFYVDKEWDPLIPVKIGGRYLNHTEYNNHWNLDKIYNNINTLDTYLSIDHRIPHVIEKMKSGQHKLQYFQLLLPFKQ